VRVCVPALVIRHAKRMRRAMFRPAVPYFSMLSRERHDFRITVIEHRMCVQIFCTNIHCRIYNFNKIQQDVINVDRSARAVPLFLSDFDKT
jgi:hypothetical protein